MVNLADLRLIIDRDYKVERPREAISPAGEGTACRNKRGRALTNVPVLRVFIVQGVLLMFT